MLTKLFNLLVTNFGFDNTTDFGNSLIHTKLLMVTIPIATMIGVLSSVETLVGLKLLTIISFIILILLELLTGIIASRVKKIPLSSKKFSRFGLKILVWLCLLFITNAIKEQYSHGNFIDSAVSSVFELLHTTLFAYISLEYLISVIENLSVITGKKYTNLLKILKSKLTDTTKK